MLRDRINEAWMRAGVTIVDPATTWIDVDRPARPDAAIEPNTHLRGATTIGEGAVVGPDTTLIDVRGRRAGARGPDPRRAAPRSGPAPSVGPFAYLRPGTVLHAESKVGTFVEVKNSEVGRRLEGPASVLCGRRHHRRALNIGAANVFVNYDGVAKHRTVIGSHVRTGSDTMLVAPVTVGDGAYTAAGSVITKDVPPGALGVARAPQRNVEGWVERRRAGTGSAEGASAAGADRGGRPSAAHRPVRRAGSGPGDTSVRVADSNGEPPTG